MGKQLFGKRIYCAYYAVSYYFIGKTSYKNVFHLMTVPIVFIIMGAAAIAISIGQNSGDMLFHCISAILISA